MTWLCRLLRPHRDPNAERVRKKTEHLIEQERGDLRNTLQVIQSHNRRLTIMAGALALKDH